MLNENRMDAASGAFAASAQRADGSVLRKHFVLDTNVLLHNANSIFKFAEHEVVIPLAVIEELDTFKKNNDERGRNARQVTRALDRLRAQGALFEGVVWNEQGGSIRVARCNGSRDFALDLDKADNRILAVAQELHLSGKRTVFISKDINARVKSDALGIPAEDFEHDHIAADFLHAGYIVMKVPGELIDELYDERQVSIERLAEFTAHTPDGVHEVEVEAVANQFVMLVDEGDEHHTGLARMLADTGVAIPVTGPRKPVYGIMGRNVQQTMALELLLDDDVKIVTLTGPAGTGKTLLAIAA
ncbi:MAG: PIN domain-containing protein, partial [bacterium]